MPLYPPRSEPVRKKQILEKRIVELKHALKHDDSEIKKRKAAEAVRVAQLKLSKAKLASIKFEKESEGKSKQMNNIKMEKEEWLGYSVEEIFSRYGN